MCSYVFKLFKKTKDKDTKTSCIWKEHCCTQHTLIFNYAICKKHKRRKKSWNKKQQSREILKKGTWLNKPKNIVSEKNTEKNKKGKNKLCCLIQLGRVCLLAPIRPNSTHGDSTLLFSGGECKIEDRRFQNWLYMRIWKIWFKNEGNNFNRGIVVSKRDILYWSITSLATKFF